MCEAAGKLGNTGLFLLPEVCGLSSRVVSVVNGARAVGKDAAMAIILWTSGFPEVLCGFGDLLEKEQPLGSWAKR